MRAKLGLKLPAFDEISFAISRLRLRRAVQFDVLLRRISAFATQSWMLSPLPVNGVDRRVDRYCSVERYICDSHRPLCLMSYVKGPCRGLLVVLQSPSHGSIFVAEYMLQGEQLMGYVDVLCHSQHRDLELDALWHIPGERRMRLKGNQPVPTWRIPLSGPHCLDFSKGCEEFEPAGEALMLLLGRYGDHIQRLPRPQVDLPALSEILDHSALLAYMEKRGDVTLVKHFRAGLEYSPR